MCVRPAGVTVTSGVTTLNLTKPLPRKIYYCFVLLFNLWSTTPTYFAIPHHIVYLLIVQNLIIKSEQLNVHSEIFKTMYKPSKCSLIFNWSAHRWSLNLVYTPTTHPPQELSNKDDICHASSYCTTSPWKPYNLFRLYIQAVHNSSQYNCTVVQLYSCTVVQL